MGHKVQKRKKKKRRPLSSRMSDDKAADIDKDGLFDAFMDKMDNDQMEYVQYDQDTNDLNDLLVALREDIECNLADEDTMIAAMPILTLSHSLSEEVPIKKSTKIKRKLQKQIVCEPDI